MAQLGDNNNVNTNGQYTITVESSQPLRIPAGVPSGLHRGMDPPSYEEAINPASTPPPSYESLFGRVKEARKSSAGVLDFIKNLIILILGTNFSKCNFTMVLLLTIILVFFTLYNHLHIILVGCTVIVGGTLIIPIGMIVMGSLYMYQCPQGAYIPVYLLVGGLLGVLKELLHLSVKVRKTTEEMDAERIRHKPAHTLIFCFMIGWFVIGSVWVYELYEPNYDPEQGPYCNKTLYLFAYWLTTSVYIFLALITFCACSLGGTTFLLYSDQSFVSYLRNTD